MNFIDIKESAFMALDTVRVNKLRSALTILGVSVGVVTVMFMVSIIQGLNKAFAAQVESLGSNTIWALKFEAQMVFEPSDSTCAANALFKHHLGFEVRSKFWAPTHERRNPSQGTDG